MREIERESSLSDSIRVHPIKQAHHQLLVKGQAENGKKRVRERKRKKEKKNLDVKRPLESIVFLSLILSLPLFCLTGTLERERREGAIVIELAGNCGFQSYTRWLLLLLLMLGGSMGVCVLEGRLASFAFFSSARVGDYGTRDVL